MSRRPHLALQAAEVFDLTMAVAEADQGFSGQVAYDETLFDDETIRAHGRTTRACWRPSRRDPDQRLSQLPLLSDAERQQVLVEWNGPSADSAAAGLRPPAIRGAGTAQAGAVAAVFEGQTMTYGELDARANRLARYLQTRGVGPEVLVGICLEPSLEMAVAILAVLKAGGAYVPLDPDDPRERLDFFVADSRPAVVLTTTALADKISDRQTRCGATRRGSGAIQRHSDENPPCGTTPDNAMFVLYTSGSTGKPKGAINLHRGVANRLLWEQPIFGWGRTTASCSRRRLASTCRSRSSSAA